MFDVWIVSFGRSAFFSLLKYLLEVSSYILSDLIDLRVAVVLYNIFVVLGACEEWLSSNKVTFKTRAEILVVHCGLSVQNIVSEGLKILVAKLLYLHLV